MATLTKTISSSSVVKYFGVNDTVTCYVYDEANTTWISSDSIVSYKIIDYLNRPKEFEATFEAITDTEKSYIKENSHIMFYYGLDQRIFRGIIQKVSYTTAYSCETKGLGEELRLLNKEFIKGNDKRVQYTNESAQTIAQEILALNSTTTSPDYIMTPTTSGIFDTDWGDYSMRVEYGNRLKALAELANGIKYDWWVNCSSTLNPTTSDDRFNIASLRGTTSPTMEFNISGSSSNANVSSKETDTGYLVNKIDILGYGDGINQLHTFTYAAADNISGTLSSSMDATTTTINVSSTTGFFNSEIVRVAEEHILIGTMSSTQFKKCLRGFQGTVASGHQKGVYYERFSTTDLSNSEATDIIATTDLEGNWQMNDNASSTTIVDTSGVGNTGEAQRNTSLLSTTGQIAEAMHFNGTSDYIDCGNDSSLSITGAITNCMWIKMRAASSGGTFLSKGYNSAGAKDSYSLIQAGSNATLYGYAYSLFWGQQVNVPKGIESLNPAFPLFEETWTHVAVSYDGSGGYSGMRMYINGGEIVALGVNTFTGFDATTEPLTIGNISSDGSIGAVHLNADIDDTRVYSRCLTDTEILNIYKGGQAAHSDSSLDTYGLMDKSIIDRTLTNTSTAEKIASDYLLDHKDPVVRIRLNPSDPMAVLQGVEVGDYVTVTDAEAGISGNYRLVGLSFTGSYGLLDLELELSNKTENLLAQLSRERDQAETMQKYMTGATNIYWFGETDNCDNDDPLMLKIYIPEDAVAINKVAMRFSRPSFRGYTNETGDNSNSYNTLSAPFDKEGHGPVTLNVIDELSQTGGTFNAHVATLSLFNLSGTTYNYEMKIRNTDTGSTNLATWTGSLADNAGHQLTHLTTTDFRDSTWQGLVTTAYEGNNMIMNVYTDITNFGIFEPASETDVDVNVCVGTTSNVVSSFSGVSVGYDSPTDIDLTDEITTTGWHTIYLVPTGGTDPNNARFSAQGYVKCFIQSRVD